MDQVFLTHSDKHASLPM